MKLDDEKKAADELIGKIAKDDRSALGTLYELFKSSVYGLALAILKNRSDAEDVMQNVFLKVWDNAPSYRPGTDAGAWIMKITRNLSLDRFRKQKNMTDIMTVEDSLQGGDDLSPELDRMLLDHLLTALDCTERQIVMLHDVGGYTHREIAQILGKPGATVRWKYGNAMKKLQSFFEKEDSYDEKVQLGAKACKSASYRG